MLRSLFLLFSLFFSQAAICQRPVLQWAKGFAANNIYNYDATSNGRTMATDRLGNVYSAGLFMYRVDFDPGQGVYNMDAGGIGNRAIFVSKLSPNGDFIWAKQIPELIEYTTIELKLDNDGNIYLTSDLLHPADMDPGPGVVILTPKGARDAFIIKWDTNGDFVWAKQFEGNDQNSGSNASSLDIDMNGDILLTGTFSKNVDFDPGLNVFSFTTLGNAEAYITKLNRNGDFIWARKIGNFNSLYGNVNITDIKYDHSGNICLTGDFSGDCDFDPGTNVYRLIAGGFSDGFISKLDATGNFLWAKKLGNSIYNLAILPTGIDIDDVNNIYTTGGFEGSHDFDPGNNVFILNSNLGLMDTYILKLDSQGNFKWVKGIGGEGNDDGGDLTVDNSNNIYTTGTFMGTVDFDPGPGVFVINNMYSETALTKFNDNGNFIYAAPFLGINGSATNFGKRMVTDPAQNIYITGYSGGNTDFDPGAGIYTINYTSGIFPYVLKLSKCTNITTFTLNINTCSSYTLNNVTFDSSGTYTQIIPNATGCDSIITLNLTVNRKFISVNATICEGQTYYAGGANQTTTGIYKDTLLTSIGCDSIITTNLQVNPKPKPDLGPDGNICTNSQGSITPGLFNRYLWQDNSTLPDYIVTSTGKYWVKVTDANNCSATDTLNVLSIDTIPKNFLPTDKQLCYGDVLRITVPNYSVYQWSTGSTTGAIDISSFGRYYLTVKDFNNCIGTDSISIQRKNCIYIAIPNAFTPNGDTKNDIFKPIINQAIKSFSFIVFNRYGQTVFETREYGKGWDGTLKGKPQPSGSYVYHIKYTNIFGVETVENGAVLLIR